MCASPAMLVASASPPLVEEANVTVAEVDPGIIMEVCVAPHESTGNLLLTNFLLLLEEDDDCGRR